jgi:hypothetical protein
MFYPNYFTNSVDWQLYLEGLGFRSTGRFLKVSHVSVQKWIKKFGQELEDLKSENEISIVEMDEMHTYIGNKKNIAGSGLLLIELGKFINCSFGSRGTEIRPCATRRACGCIIHY